MARATELLPAPAGQQLSSAGRRPTHTFVGSAIAMRNATVYVAVVLLLLSASVVGSAAAWVVTVSNSGNQFSSAASFPNYPSSVTADGAWAYHREEESPSAAGTLVAADSSGNARPGTFTGTTNGPSTWWKFDENAGTTAADSSGGANAGTLTGAPAWAAGPSSAALAFNGSTSHVAGTGRAVRTNAPFSVAAWVNLANLTGAVDQAAVSQNGAHTYGFMLGWNAASKKWTFNMTDSDLAAPVVKAQVSSLLAVPGTWTHLVGVYDQAINRIFLYVNGNVIGNATKTVYWDATGPLQAGRMFAGDAWAGYFDGKVDDVRVYHRALTAAQVANLAQDRPLNRWDFAEAAGGSTADSGTVGNTGTLGSAASFTAGHAGNAITMSDNANGYVQGATMGVSTNRSFSVSSWAYLSSSSTAGTVRAMVSQPGTNTSGFLFGVGTDNKWRFALPQSDVAGPAEDFVSSNAAAATDTWVHLTGVFDTAANAGNGSLALYVNGTLQAATSQHTAANRIVTIGSLQVGRAWWAGAFQYPWYGRVDSLRLYQRALDQAAVTALSGDAEPASTHTEAAMTAGVIGALQGPYQGLSGSTAVAFAGAATAYNDANVTNPTTFTLECWFKVSGTAGGELIGFHATTSGAGVAHDRQVFVDSGGRITFGTWATSEQTVRSPAAYNDGTWHHVAASLGAAGMRLHVDGVLVDSNAVTTAGNYSGYWRWGGGDLANWSNRPAGDYLTGSLDEIAVYPTQLTDTQVKQHYQRDY